MRQFFFCILILVLSNKLFGQHSKPDTLNAMPFPGQITLDGQLNEHCWSDAIAIENFTQREQTEGLPASEKTRIAIVYRVMYHKCC
jgi:hypothetical protein